MPLRLFNSSNSQGKLSKKKGSYSPTPPDGSTVVYRPRSATLGRPASRSRRHTSPPPLDQLPPSILKKGRGRSSTSYPALVEGMTPQEMAAAVPMPLEIDLNKMFIQLVVSDIKAMGEGFMYRINLVC